MATCGDIDGEFGGDIGGGQSPIDMSGWIESDAPAPKFEYASAAVSVKRQQGLPLIHFARGSRLRSGDEAFELLQLHWHTPAEHTIEGQEFAAELHHVHQNEANQLNQLLVVGTVYRLGAADSSIQLLLDSLIAGSEDQLDLDTDSPLSAADVAPASDGFYHYSGSLTAPPYSEPVRWYLSRAARSISQDQVERLQALTNGPNARPLQDRNDRRIRLVR